MWIQEENKLVKKKELTEQQKLFCQYYVSEDTYWNGTRAYLLAYPDSEYDNARSSASRLLSDANICQHIADLLDKAGFTKENADKQLLMLMNQHEDRQVKLWAIKHFNQIHARTEAAISKAIKDGAVDKDIFNFKVIVNGSNNNDSILE